MFLNYSCPRCTVEACVLASGETKLDFFLPDSKHGIAKSSLPSSCMFGALFKNIPEDNIVMALMLPFSECQWYVAVLR